MLPGEHDTRVGADNEVIARNHIPVDLRVISALPTVVAPADPEGCSTVLGVVGRRGPPAPPQSGALGFGLSFPHRRGPYGPTNCLYGQARLRRTSHTLQPPGWRAGHTPPSVVVSSRR